MAILLKRQLTDAEKQILDLNLVFTHSDVSIRNFESIINKSFDRFQIKND
ncbi:hypothetical protein ig2599ANME_0175 [groundwater metagenome]